MKNLAFLGGAAGLGLVALLAAQRGYAADHLDSPSLASTPMSDINDVYAWMDGGKLNLALSISPADALAREFGPDVQYVFHVHSRRGIGIDQGTGTETRILCTFASNTSGQCWVLQGLATRDYIKGDPSGTDGITNESGRVRLFAGRRSDPFFFNLQGFRAMAAALQQRFAQGMPAADAAGCPDGLTTPEVTGFAGLLGASIPGTPPCTGTSRDCFADLNVKIILVQLDPLLVNVGTNTAVSVWASTHRTPEETP